MRMNRWHSSLPPLAFLLNFRFLASKVDWGVFLFFSFFGVLLILIFEKIFLRPGIPGFQGYFLLFFFTNLKKKIFDLHISPHPRVSHASMCPSHNKKCCYLPSLTVTLNLSVPHPHALPTFKEHVQTVYDPTIRLKIKEKLRLRSYTLKSCPAMLWAWNIFFQCCFFNQWSVCTHDLAQHT